MENKTTKQNTEKKNLEFRILNWIHSIFHIPNSIFRSSIFHIPNSNFRPRGSLLLELLIVISILAIILSIGAQAISVSLRSGKVSGERDVASALAGEALESVRGATEEKWQNLYTLTKTSQNYYATTTNNKWVIATGTEIIAINNASYTRYFTVNNVSRDPSTRLIESSYNSANDDPSTQQVTAVVSWSGGLPFTVNQYFFRWKNKVCNQTDWSGGTGSGAKNCPDTTYGSQDGNINTSGGTLKLQ